MTSPKSVCSAAYLNVISRVANKKITDTLLTYKKGNEEGIKMVQLKKKAQKKAVLEELRSENDTSNIENSKNSKPSPIKNQFKCK